MDADSDLIARWTNEEARWREQFQGWDFSKLIETGRIQFNMSEDQLGWDYATIVGQTIAERMSRNDNDPFYLLDLGTAGGEFLETILLRLAIEKQRLRVYATESHEPNFILAQQRLRQHGVAVFLTESDSLNSTLPFAESDVKFDLIISRHTCYNIREVNRLLRPGTGLFITEQVDGRSEMDLIRLFGHEPQWPFFTLSFASSVVREQAPNLELLTAKEAETKVVFKEIDALIIYLHAVPWLVEDFSVEKYQRILLDLHHRQPRDLVFTSKYMLLKAIKCEERC